MKHIKKLSSVLLVAFFCLIAANNAKAQCASYTIINNTGCYINWGILYAPGTSCTNNSTNISCYGNTPVIEPYSSTVMFDLYDCSCAIEIAFSDDQTSPHGTGTIVINNPGNETGVSNLDLCHTGKGIGWNNNTITIE